MVTSWLELNDRPFSGNGGGGVEGPAVSIMMKNKHSSHLWDQVDNVYL